MATRKEALVESTARDLELSLAEARALAEAGRRLAARQVVAADEDEPDTSVIRCTMNPAGTWSVTVTDAVGMIAVGDLRLLVEPKIPRAHLFHLFASSDLFPRLDDTHAASATGAHLWELVARWLVQALEQVIRRDLVRDYLPVHDTLEAARGTIDTLATADTYYQGSLALVCDFEEFGTDTPLNRVLRAAALAVVASTDLSYETRRRALRITARMEDVGTLQPGDLRVTLDRRTAHCRDALTLARNVLANTRRTLAHGNADVWTFLIRTPELVEAGVRNELRRRLQNRIDVQKEPIPLGGSTMTVAPDLIFGNIDAVGDVKYKLAAGRWLRTDLYEIVAFAAAANTTQASIVGFRNTNEPYPPTVSFGPTTIRYFAWLCDEDITPMVAADHLADEIANWLSLDGLSTSAGDGRSCSQEA